MKKVHSFSLTIIGSENGKDKKWEQFLDLRGAPRKMQVSIICRAFEDCMGFLFPAQKRKERYEKQ
jgi:hypothetical protein